MYIDLVENNNDKEQWTANLNCQVFVQKLMEHLNLDYPSNIRTCSDIPLTIVDISILSFRSSIPVRNKNYHQHQKRMMIMIMTMMMV
jgi:hypothetical protein